MAWQSWQLPVSQSIAFTSIGSRTPHLLMLVYVWRWGMLPLGIIRWHSVCGCLQVSVTQRVRILLHYSHEFPSTCLASLCVMTGVPLNPVFSQTTEVFYPCFYPLSPEWPLLDVTSLGNLALSSRCTCPSLCGAGSTDVGTNTLSRELFIYSLRFVRKAESSHMQSKISYSDRILICKQTGRRDDFAVKRT